jgi:hypothetical protein
MAVPAMSADTVLSDSLALTRQKRNAIATNMRVNISDKEDRATYTKDALVTRNVVATSPQAVPTRDTARIENANTAAAAKAALDSAIPRRPKIWTNAARTAGLTWLNCA